MEATKDALDPQSKKKDGKKQSISDPANTSAEVPAQSKQHKKGPQINSLMDVINHALHQTERATYLHRLTYVGQHNFKDSGEGSDELDSIFQMSINQVNESYCSEPLTGCFIYYSKYFMHIVEKFILFKGAEDSIGHHVKLIVEQIEKHGNQFGVVKIILQSHHIRRRYFGAWFSMYGVPRTLLEKIQGDAEDVIAHQIENFNKKIVTIASYLEKRDSLNEKSIGSYLSQKTLALLPEVGLLDFLLKIQSLETLYDFLKTYQQFPHLVIYQDYCWPPIMEFVPYNLYIEIPEVPKLEIPPYNPIEEIEVKRRVRGYSVTEGKKEKKSISVKEKSLSEGVGEKAAGDTNAQEGPEQSGTPTSPGAAKEPEVTV
ncbi:Uncharacterized protein GBIM_01181 [Gryllus bimaculatus]|nr:Uncharacterized protein GBIM_01181 [Gryllus bimaculatus]